MTGYKSLLREDGIAIGPILFIIAILGILASALAAGSGGFVSSSRGEASRAKASALIEIGLSLKNGYDRILTAGVSFDDITIDETSTSDPWDLFSPNGGGISAPSVMMASDPPSALWFYPIIPIGRHVTAFGNRLAMLNVSRDVCVEINKLLGVNIDIDVPRSIGDIVDTINVNSAAVASWPEELRNRDSGCFLALYQQDANIISGYVYYQVIAVRMELPSGG